MGSGSSGPSIVLMNHGKGNDGSGGHPGNRPHNTEIPIQNTINLNTKNLMKPAFINDHEMMHMQSMLGKQAQGLQVINQKIMSMGNESHIPLVAHS
jgi:hypothetical protein